MAFSFAVAALIEGRVDAAWGRWVRPWTLAAWIFLTIGIALGSWWAYYELGWGGFWFWDPVENASLHALADRRRAAAFRHRGGKARGAEELDDPAGDPRLRLLADRHVHRALGRDHLGPCLCQRPRARRVHPDDPGRVHGRRADAVRRCAPARWRRRACFALVSRESALVANNLLLAVSSFVVFIGTIWPLVAELLFDRKLSVGAPFFNMAFTPFVVALAVLLPLGAMLPWKRGRSGPGAAAAWAGRWCCRWRWARWPGRCRPDVRRLGPIGVDPRRLGGVRRAGRPLAARRARRAWREAVAPDPAAARRLGQGDGTFGFGVTIFAVAAHDTPGRSRISAWSRSARASRSGPYEVTLQDVREVHGPNYIATRPSWSSRGRCRRWQRCTPKSASTRLPRMPTTEAGIDHGLMRDLYLVIGDRRTTAAGRCAAISSPS